MWINMSSSWEKICKLIFFQIPIGIWWHWVSRGHYLLVLRKWDSIRRYWLVLDCTWSVEGGTGCYFRVLGQNRVVLVSTWWYWIKTGRYFLPVWYAFRKYLVYMVWTIKSLNTGSVEGGYWLVLSGTGSEQGGTGCQHDELSENIWFAWSKPSNHWIFEEGKSDDGQIHRQTDPQTEFPLVDSTPSVEGVE